MIVYPRLLVLLLLPTLATEHASLSKAVDSASSMSNAADCSFSVDAEQSGRVDTISSMSNVATLSFDAELSGGVDTISSMSNVGTSSFDKSKKGLTRAEFEKSTHSKLAALNKHTH